MSQAANEKLALRAWQGVAEGEVQALLETWDTKIVWHSAGLHPWSGRFEGIDAVLNHIADLKPGLMLCHAGSSLGCCFRLQVSEEQRQDASVIVDAVVGNLAVAEKADQRHITKLVLDSREFR